MSPLQSTAAGYLLVIAVLVCLSYRSKIRESEQMPRRYLHVVVLLLLWPVFFVLLGGAALIAFTRALVRREP